MNKSTVMTEGPIWRKILFFSIPLILGNLFQQLYNTVDSIIVGNYIGSEALAAVGSSGSIINLLIGFCIGASAGAGVVISQFFGARDKEGVRKAVHTTIAIAIVVWTAFLTPSLSRAPKNWEMTTPAPADAPMQNPISRLMMDPLEPTAASASLPI